ncbi:hypothetical protein IF1G_09015 [Cordyceps javanica]|uniref:Uncharacterized protein n=1 Tax=Cordyceps javanica TaxID=43265 RepID=A0A545USP3_9HYPO|nr:hypothetical protein IF1G_09015 [Cordyceps javanica]
MALYPREEDASPLCDFDSSSRAHLTCEASSEIVCWRALSVLLGLLSMFDPRHYSANHPCSIELGKAGRRGPCTLSSRLNDWKCNS